jgi:hypothetical protein
MGYSVSYNTTLAPYLYSLQNNNKLPVQELPIVLEKAKADQSVIADNWAKEIEAHEKTKNIAFVVIGILGVLCAFLAFKILKK